MSVMILAVVVLSPTYSTVVTPDRRKDCITDKRSCGISEHNHLGGFQITKIYRTPIVKSTLVTQQKAPLFFRFLRNSH